jgi:hypothetical protein
MAELAQPSGLLKQLLLSYVGQYACMAMRTGPGPPTGLDAATGGVELFARNLRAPESRIKPHLQSTVTSKTVSHHKGSRVADSRWTLPCTLWDDPYHRLTRTVVTILKAAPNPRQMAYPVPSLSSGAPWK